MTETRIPAAAKVAPPEPTVDATARTVKFGDLELTPAQARELATQINSAAIDAESAVIHKAGDIFSTTGMAVRFFVSDGVFLFELSAYAPNARAYDVDDLPNLRLVRLQSGESLGDVIRAAVTG